MALLYSVNQSLSPPLQRFLLSDSPTLLLLKKNAVALYTSYKPKKNNPENARTKSREKRKESHFKLCNRLLKFFEEARITRSIWNRIMS